MYLRNEDSTEISDISCCEAAFSRDSGVIDPVEEYDVSRNAANGRVFSRVQETRRKPGIQAGRGERNFVESRDH